MTANAKEVKMAKTVKSCDFNGTIATKVFEMLNPSYVRVKINVPFYGRAIVTDVEPKDLVYPEGWYYAKGFFRNKHTSSTGAYDEILMLKSNGKLWGNIATYCTLE